jgi:hypothetical protein
LLLSKNEGINRIVVVIIKRVILGVCCALLYVSSYYAETKPLPRMETLKPWEVIPETIDDYGCYLTSPLRWDSKQWKTFTDVMLITGALFLIDKPIYDNIGPENASGVTTALRPFFQVGDWQKPMMALPLLYGVGFAVGDTKFQHATFLAMKSFGAQILITQSLKNLLYRDIHTTKDPLVFWGPRWELPSQGGLPSGHAAISWSILTAYAEAYRDDSTIPALCYTSAVLANIPLITNRHHWVSDIFLGAAIGYYTAQAAVYLENRHNNEVVWVPLLYNGSPALAATVIF